MPQVTIEASRKSTTDDRSLFDLGRRYIVKVDAQLQLLELTQRLAKPVYAGVLQKESKRLSPAQKRELTKAVNEMGRALGSAMEHAEEAAKDESPLFRLTISDQHVASIVGRVITEVTRRANVKATSETLRRSILNSATSDFEVLLGSVASYVLRQVPGLIKSSEATLTLKQLLEFGTVERATAHVIEKQVDDLLREDLFAWASWLEQIPVKLQDMTDDWGKLAEIFARRNLAVHNDCRVNLQYMRKIAKAGVNHQPEVGDVLEVDDSYLREAIERLAAAGILLCAGVDLQINKSQSENALSWLAKEAELLAEYGQYRTSLIVCTTVLKASRGRNKRSIELKMLKSKWVSMQGLGLQDEMRQAVSAWDVSGLDGYYAHVRHALLGNRTELIQTTRELMKSHRLTAYDLIHDPIYSPYQKDPEFAAMIDPATEIHLPNEEASLAADSLRDLIDE